MGDEIRTLEEIDEHDNWLKTVYVVNKKNR